jgi:predicted transcriptional regulator
MGACGFTDKSKAGIPECPIDDLPGIRLGAWLDVGLSGDAAMPESDAEPASSKARRSRPAAKAPERKSVRADGRTKVTLLLSDSVDFRLTSIAASQKSDRSTLATQLIDAGLRRFALDAALRQHAGGDAGTETERAGE